PGVNNCACCVQILSVDFSGATGSDIEHFCLSGHSDRRRAVRVDLKLVVVHSLDSDVAGAVDCETFEVRNGNSDSYRLRDGVILTILQSKYIAVDFSLHKTEYVLVAFDLETRIFLTGDFDRECAVSRD